MNMNTMINMFSSDTLAQETYLNETRGSSKTFHSPELRLMFATLEDAINLLIKGMGVGLKQEHVFQETLDWLLSDEIDYAFSFESICDQFNFNVSAFRKKILDMIKKEGLAPRVQKKRIQKSMGNRLYTRMSVEVDHRKIRKVVGARPNRLCQHYNYKDSSIKKHQCRMGGWICWCCDKCGC